MKRNSLVAVLLCVCFAALLPGCSSAPKEEAANPGMNEQQKAILADHKKKADQ